MSLVQSHSQQRITLKSTIQISLILSKSDCICVIHFTITILSSKIADPTKNNLSLILWLTNVDFYTHMQASLILPNRATVVLSNVAMLLCKGCWDKLVMGLFFEHSQAYKSYSEG